MKIRLLTITHKSPEWIKNGFEEYAKRLPPNFSLELLEIPAEKRLAHSDLNRLKEREGEKMLALMKPTHHIISLDVKGRMFTTEELSKHLSNWRDEGRNIDLLIGGPDGLSEKVLKKSQFSWSLSPLTFPHLLVRIIVAEQIYRAWSILQKHPYHRE